MAAHPGLWRILSVTYPESLSLRLGTGRTNLFFYSAITGAIQRLERLSRVSYIDRAELETCLLSRSTLSSLVRLLPISEYDLRVQEMTILKLPGVLKVLIDLLMIERTW